MEKFVKKDVKKNDITCVGSIKFLEPGNGVDTVINAFAKMLGKSEAEAVLKIVGAGSQESALKDQVDRLGIGDRVEFTGYIKNGDMPDMINTMDIVVQMTPVECFGVSAVEAMACEVPVVSSDTYGSSEFMLESVTGYLVKSGNEEACANRMAELIKNKSARERMGKMAREDVLPLYSLPECMDKFEKALKSVAG
jgi:glycosyltransferase involved in cell wall biosynthesis